jgi:hypothetical protein
LCHNTYSQQVNGGSITATERLREVYRKHNGTFEQGENTHPTIANINAWIDLPKKSAYCGSTIVWMCKEAGLELVDVPITKMGLARNWKHYGKVKWDSYNGWRAGVKHEPAADEIFVLYFNWNGRGHVGVALWYHGGINYITGEGNTSNAKVRKKKYGMLSEGLPSVAELYVPAVMRNGKPVYRQGIFAYKERYQTKGLTAIVAVKVKVVKGER